MNTRLVSPAGSARITGRFATAVVTVLGVLSGGLMVTAPAYADAPNGVSIDVGGAGGDGFVADAFGQGGSADTMPSWDASFPNWGPTVAHPIPAAIWNTSRVGESHYSIPGLAVSTTYQARLYFMDWYFTHYGQRKFDVAINGTNVLTNFDIIGTANDKGADGQEAFGVEKDFPVTVGPSGTVSIDFTRNSADQPQVNAIVLVPASS
jgi:hypothetical protein